MSSILLSVFALMPLVVGLLLAIPLYLLLQALLRNRHIQLWLFRRRLIRGGWQPVFLRRYSPDRNP